MIQLITGLIASSAHVISGPDHLAAVLPLAISSKKKSWMVGLSWGIGHTLGALLIGLLFLLFRRFIKIENISTYSEQIVGIVLITIGAWAIYRTFREREHVAHDHTHDQKNSDESIYSHSHAHTHRQTRQNVFTSLGIGVIHGLAGVSHLFGVIPTLALPTRFQAVMYLTGFALGTIVVMVLFSVLMGILAHKASESRRREVFKILRIGGGVLAIVVGIYWIATTF